jgi:hypothetical protein
VHGLQRARQAVDQPIHLHPPDATPEPLLARGSGGLNRSASHVGRNGHEQSGRRARPAAPYHRHSPGYHARLRLPRDSAGTPFVSSLRGTAAVARGRRYRTRG